MARVVLRVHPRRTTECSCACEIWISSCVFVIDRPRVAFMMTVEEGAFGHDVVFDLHDA